MSGDGASLTKFVNLESVGDEKQAEKARNKPVFVERHRLGMVS
jgi:hypothetical protein